jgi:hypothetical protein
MLRSPIRASRCGGRKSCGGELLARRSGAECRFRAFPTPVPPGAASCARCCVVKTLNTERSLCRPWSRQRDFEGDRYSSICSLLACMATTHGTLTFVCREPKLSSDSYLPRYVYFARSVWRAIRNLGRQRGDVGPGCLQRFELSFFRDWVWTYPTRSRAQHAQLLANLPANAIILRSAVEVAKFANDLPRSLDSGAARQGPAAVRGWA